MKECWWYIISDMQTQAIKKNYENVCEQCDYPDRWHLTNFFLFLLCIYLQKSNTQQDASNGQPNYVSKGSIGSKTWGNGDNKEQPALIEEARMVQRCYKDVSPGFHLWNCLNRKKSFLNRDVDVIQCYADVSPAYQAFLLISHACYVA